MPPLQSLNTEDGFTTTWAGEIPDYPVIYQFDYWLGYNQDIDNLKSINWRRRVYHFRQPSLSDDTPKELLKSLGDRLLGYVEQLRQTDWVSISLIADKLSGVDCIQGKKT